MIKYIDMHIKHVHLRHNQLEMHGKAQRIARLVP